MNEERKKNLLKKMGEFRSEIEKLFVEETTREKWLSWNAEDINNMITALEYFRITIEAKGDEFIKWVWKH